MPDQQPQIYPPRVYPLDAHQLSEEQIAVTFAMTSRRPGAFDEIARQVSQEKAADFHERWVLGYGHASVAEHAVVHLAVENVSRLAVDTLEDNRLASYTEKSSRYQLLPQGYYHLPQELEGEPDLARLYQQTCERLFQCYNRLVEGCLGHLRQVESQREGERDSAYSMRLRRQATDHCRAVLPAATLTNVGVTANARVLEHAISKLLSSGLDEERRLGLEVREQSKKITPTLIKYAGENDYLRQTRALQRELARERDGSPGGGGGLVEDNPSDGSGNRETTPVEARLLEWDAQAEEKLAAALLYRHSHRPYEELWSRVLAMSPEQRQEIIAVSLEHLGPHDAPVREFELVSYTFQFLLDYGAYREFKRHRMQSYIPQDLTVAHGYRVPALIREAGLSGDYQDTLAAAGEAYQQVSQYSPEVAQYLGTHAHYRRVLCRLNLRECYHLFKLRTSSQAHFAIREPMLQALEEVKRVHPQLFQHLRLRK